MRRSEHGGGTIDATPQNRSFASGAPGQPGAGGFALPLAIPIAPALAGASLAQAMLLDPGVPVGFAVSNALELWLR